MQASFPESYPQYARTPHPHVQPLASQQQASEQQPEAATSEHKQESDEGDAEKTDDDDAEKTNVEGAKQIDKDSAEKIDEDGAKNVDGVVAQADVLPLPSSRPASRRQVAVLQQAFALCLVYA